MRSMLMRFFSSVCCKAPVKKLSCFLHDFIAASLYPESLGE